MKEKIIISVLDKASEFLTHDQVLKLRSVLGEELCGLTITPECRELIQTSVIERQVRMFIAVKKLEGLSKNTLRNYIRILNHFFLSINRNIDKVTEMDIRAYLAVRSEEVKQNTLNCIIGTLKSFYAWLTNEEYIAKDPTRNIKTVKVKKRLRHALNREELEMLRDACNNLRDKALVEFFYSTAARLDEVQKISRNDINWDKRSLRVIGKGDKEREVYLNEKACYHLKKYLETRKDSNDALFVTLRKPYARLSKRGIEKVFTALGIKAGIKKSVFPHLLRHTSATNMLRGGSPITHVQRYLGHVKPDTTLIYAEIYQDEVRMSHEKSLAG